MDAPVGQAPDDSISMRELAAIIVARRRWVIWSVIIFTVGFVAAALIMTPIYRAKAVLIPTNTATEGGGGGGLGGGGGSLGQLGGLASLAGIELGGKGSPVEEALAVLKSREFTQRFIADKNLMPELYARKWNAATHSWKGGDSEAPTPARAFKYFDEKIRSVEQDKKTGLITLQIDWKNRQESAQWANELAQRVNQEMRARATAEADASLGYLQRELAATNVVPVRDAVSRLIETQVKKRMVANVTEEYVFRIVDHAMPSDADDPQRPKKLLMFIGGPVVGLILGILAVLVAGAPRPPVRPAA
jgi:uncharacterized protein involved in exopolysaccharide biosynthesis